MLLPRNCMHRMRSEPGVPARDVMQLERERVNKRYEILRYGKAASAPRCFAAPCASPITLRALSSRRLPPAIVIDVSSSPQMDWMQSTLRLIAAEAQALQPGHEAVLTRLGDVLAIQAIRSWIQAYPPVRSGWIAALQDPKIGRRDLADPPRSRPRLDARRARARVAMSRSAFAARFTELVGEPMMHYLTRWRMHVALEALRQNGTPVAEVAGRLGYRSQAGIQPRVQASRDDVAGRRSAAEGRAADRRWRRRSPS